MKHCTEQPLPFENTPDATPTLWVDDLSDEPIDLWPVDGPWPCLTRRLGL
jgi:hypothetical protein